MAFCASLNSQHTTWIQFTKMGDAGTGSQCPYVYMTGAQFVEMRYQSQNQGQADLLNDLLEFDPAMFADVVGASLLVFIAGLSVGWVISLIRKAK